MGQPLFSKINELILRIFKEATGGFFKKKKLYKEANSSSKAAWVCDIYIYIYIYIYIDIYIYIYISQKT